MLIVIDCTIPGSWHYYWIIIVIIKIRENKAPQAGINPGALDDHVRQIILKYPDCMTGCFFFLPRVVGFFNFVAVLPAIVRFTSASRYLFLRTTLFNTRCDNAIHFLD